MFKSKVLSKIFTKLKSIRSRIVCILILSVIIFTGVSAFSLKEFHKIQTKQLYVALEQRTVANGRVIFKELEKLIEQLEVIAAAPKLKEADIYEVCAYSDRVLAEKQQKGTLFLTFTLIEKDGMGYEVKNPDKVTYLADAEWCRKALTGEVLLSPTGYSKAF